MNWNNNEIKVGAFTIAVIVLFFVILSFLGTFKFLQSGYLVKVEFDNATGLKVGNTVHYAGVDVGKVEDLKLQKNKVIVVIRMHKDFKIPDRSEFYISAGGILGEKYIDIEPPKFFNDKYIVADSTIRGSGTRGLDKFLESGQVILEKLDTIATSMAKILGDTDVQTSMKNTFENTAKITANLDKFTNVMAEIAVKNHDNVDQMIGNMTQMAAHLHTITNRLDDMLVRVDNDGATVQNIVLTAENLRITSQRVENMARAMEGVVTDPKVSEDIKKTISNARSASDKADKVLKEVTSIKVQGRVDAMYSGNSDHRYRGDANFRVSTNPNTYFLLGADSIGDGTKLNLQVGKKFDKVEYRAGIMQGTAGMGVDYNFDAKTKVFADVYDPRDLKVKLGGEYKMNKDFAFILQSYNLGGNVKDNTYLGVRAYF